ncbi:MAG: hypothetical protein QOF74_4128 [Caballeronia mineralivorans]|jgi:hypothetical protein|nr:hypothetical protein [Caballeronia mineralivorans]
MRPYFYGKNRRLHDVFVCTIGSHHRAKTPNILWFCLCDDDIECYTFVMETRRVSALFSTAKHVSSRAPDIGLFESECTRKDSSKRVVEGHDPKRGSGELNASRAALALTVEHADAPGFHRSNHESEAVLCHALTATRNTTRKTIHSRAGRCKAPSKSNAEEREQALHRTRSTRLRMKLQAVSSTQSVVCK